MRFASTVIESLAFVAPPQSLGSDELERRLKPLYERLRLPEGRLELMTGIRERRYWPGGKKASEASAEAARAVLARSRVPRGAIGAFMHAAVCRDMLEPATASLAHHLAGLPSRCQVFDVSNACLGFLNGMVLAAGLIESGQIGAALVASGENGYPLTTETLERLLDGTLDRNAIKPYFANLTIGSGAVAAVLCHRDLAPEGHRLVGGAVEAATEHATLCQGDAAGGGALQMQTDSEAMLVAGVDLAARTWEAFTEATGWTAETTDRFVTHQVGAAHRRTLYTRLGLDLARDYSSFERLGNMGSVSLPATLALAAESGFVQRGHRVGLLGIGSGLNCLMLGVEWRGV